LNRSESTLKTFRGCPDPSGYASVSRAPNGILGHHMDILPTPPRGIPYLPKVFYFPEVWKTYSNNKNIIFGQINIETV